MSNQLTLVGLKGHLYPHSISDFEILKARGVTNFRLPVSSVPFLKKSKALPPKFEVRSFQNVWEPFAESFEKELEAMGLEFCMEGNNIWLIRCASAELPKLKLYLAKVALFMRRFCINCKPDYKTNSKGDSMCKVLFIYSDEINNSYAYVNCKDEFTASELHLTEFLKLRVERFYLDTSPMVSIIIMDKTGDVWSESVRRSARHKHLEKKDLEKMAQFLLSLT